MGQYRYCMTLTAELVGYAGVTPNNANAEGAERPCKQGKTSTWSLIISGKVDLADRENAFDHGGCRMTVALLSPKDTGYSGLLERTVAV